MLPTWTLVEHVDFRSVILQPSNLSSGLSGAEVDFASQAAHVTHVIDCAKI